MDEAKRKELIELLDDLQHEAGHAAKCQGPSKAHHEYNVREIRDCILRMFHERGRANG